MTKYPQCRKRFGRRPFKQRYFRLTTQSLCYAKSKGKQPICDIPLSEIERVEQLNEKSFKMQNCFKVSTTTHQCIPGILFDSIHIKRIGNNFPCKWHRIVQR